MLLITPTAKENTLLRRGPAPTPSPPFGRARGVVNPHQFLCHLEKLVWMLNK